MTVLSPWEYAARRFERPADHLHAPQDGKSQLCPRLLTLMFRLGAGVQDVGRGFE
jgi:hypothetical protein